MLLGGYYGTVLIIKHLPQQRAYRQFRLKQAGAAKLENGTKLHVEDIWTLEPSAQTDGASLVRLLCRWEGGYPPDQYHAIWASLMDASKDDSTSKLNETDWRLALSSLNRNASFIWEFSLRKDARLPDHFRLRISYIKENVTIPMEKGETNDHYTARVSQILQKAPYIDLVIPNVSVLRDNALPPEY